MLGEGYDHVYLSIAAIFRPFKSELPYEQFIGRVLRAIPDNEVGKLDDNIADVISHKNLNLIELWNKYKVEIQESEVIKHLQNENIMIDSDGNESTTDSNDEIKLALGVVSEVGKGTYSEDTYLNTELIKRHKEEVQKQKKDIKKLQELLSIDYEQALSIYNQTRTKDTAAIKRPDLYFSSRKKNLDVEIREVIVPELITKYGINQMDKTLDDCRLFTNSKYSWIKASAKNNGAMLALFFNTYLKSEIGKSRDTWTTYDYDNAFIKLPVVKEFVQKVLSDYMQP